MPTLDLTILQDGAPVNGVQTNRAFARVVSITSVTGDPAEYVLTTSGSTASNATTITLTSAPTGVVLEKGTILYFGASTVTVSTTTTVTTSTSVPIYTYTGTTISTATASAPVWGLLTLPVSDISGWNQTINTVDAKTLGYGEQSQDERVSAMWDLSLSLILPPSNAAYYKHILPSADNHQGQTGRIQLFVGIPASNAGSFEYGIGPALVTITSDPNPKNEIRRPVLSAKFQYPYMKTTNYDNESAPRKTLITTACKAAGVALPV